MLVLDTHVLIWWVNGDSKLSENAKSQITQSVQQEKPILISSITAWEISMLVEKGRLTLTMDVDAWLQTVGEINSVYFVPIDNKVALESTRLPGDFHKDPADRMIVALARAHSYTLVTADEKILDYKYVRTIN